MYTANIQPEFEEVIGDVVDCVVEAGEFWINFVEIEDLENGNAGRNYTD